MPSDEPILAVFRRVAVQPVPNTTAYWAIQLDADPHIIEEFLDDLHITNASVQSTLVSLGTSVMLIYGSQFGHPVFRQMRQNGLAGSTSDAHRQLRGVLPNDGCRVPGALAAAAVVDTTTAPTLPFPKRPQHHARVDTAYSPTRC